MLLHLADNFDLRNEAPSNHYKWASTSLPSSRCKFLAALCGMIAANDPQLPYGFDRTGISIDRFSGKVTLGAEGKGLTCASFILAALETYGLRLLKEEEWPRDANTNWQTDMIEHFKAKGNASEEQIRALEGETGACRFAPNEVVGAGTIRPWPVGYAQATILGILVGASILEG